VHLYDAHDPYDPPAPYATRFANALYDGEIAYSDACVGKLIAALRQAGLYDGTLVAVMADHGEALGQHGEETHGVFFIRRDHSRAVVVQASGRRIDRPPSGDTGEPCGCYADGAGGCWRSGAG